MKEYTRPELEITEFELEDVLAGVELGSNPNMPKTETHGWY